MDINGYMANNPFVKTVPLKHRFMSWAFLTYRKWRIFLSRWIPLQDWQIHMWENGHKGDFEQQNNALYSREVNNTNAQLFFHLEIISILELIPKEQMDDVIAGIGKFRYKHGNNNIYDLHGGDATYFKKFHDGDAFTNLGNLSIKNESKLRKYINQIGFQTINISESFCCLNILIHINKEIKDDLTSYAISNVPNQRRVSGFEGKRWYQITELGSGTSSGGIHKSETVETIITDIKWNVMKEVARFIKPVLFQSQSTDSPCVCSILTNIDGTHIQNKEFWWSLNVEPGFCDFYNNDTAFIAWRNRHTTPFFIYSRDETNDLYHKSEHLSHHIGDELCSYLIASKVDQLIREKLTNYSFELSKHRRKNARHWLKSKVKADINMFYEARFLNEYKYMIEDEYFSDFTNFNKQPIILLHYKNIQKRIDKTKVFFESVNNLYKSTIDYKNAESLYGMQRVSITISMISAIVAVVAIVVSISLDDIKVNQINTYFSQIKQFLGGY